MSAWDYFHRSNAPLIVIVAPYFVFAKSHEVPDTLYFIEHGVALTIAPYPNTRRTEIALMGPETFVSAAVVMTDGRWPYRTFVQVDHLTAICLPVAAARIALQRSPSLKRLLTQAVFA